MRVLQTVFGVFHHFELARELSRFGHQTTVLSTWPWSRLKREGLAREQVRTFPWFSIPEYALNRADVGFHWLRSELGYRNALAFDRWTDRQVQRESRAGIPIDALIAISGSSLRAGQTVQAQGGLFICDRGSTHHAVQDRIMTEEFRRWGVTQPHSDPRDIAREEAIYAQADLITVPSRFAAETYLDAGVPASKLRVIPYGAKLDAFRPGVQLPPSGEFSLLFAGAACLRKGVPYLLEAFAQLRHPRKRLRLAGPVMADLKSVLPRLALDGVEFLGPLRQPELAQWMARSDILVMPSVEEGLAMVQAQAMACGCALVCSTHSGGADLITEGVEGFIVPARDSAALTTRLHQLAEDPRLLQSMRAAALLRVQSLGGWADYGQRWDSLLREAAHPGQNAILAARSSP